MLHARHMQCYAPCMLLRHAAPLRRAATDCLAHSAHTASLVPSHHTRSYSAHWARYPLSPQHPIDKHTHTRTRAFAHHAVTARRREMQRTMGGHPLTSRYTPPLHPPPPLHIIPPPPTEPPSPIAFGHAWPCAFSLCGHLFLWQVMQLKAVVDSCLDQPCHPHPHTPTLTITALAPTHTHTHTHTTSS